MSPSDDLPSTPTGAPNKMSPSAGAASEGDATRGATAAPWSSGRTWAVLLASAFVVGFASFGVGEAAPALVPPSRDFPPEMLKSRQQIPMELERRTQVSKDRSASIAYGSLGLALGLALGAVGGLTRRNARAALAAGLTGVVLGGAAGAGATALLVPSYHAARKAASDDDVTSDLALALRTHAGIWAAVGASAGLAFGLGLGGGGRMARAAVGALLGAGLAAVFYEFVGALAFPLAQTFRPVAESFAPRLLAHLSVAVGAAAGALLAVQHLHARREPSRPIQA
jgi:hypothetical protein